MISSLLTRSPLSQKQRERLKRNSKQIYVNNTFYFPDKVGKPNQNYSLSCCGRYFSITREPQRTYTILYPHAPAMAQILKHHISVSNIDGNNPLRIVIRTVFYSPWKVYYHTTGVRKHFYTNYDFLCLSSTSCSSAVFCALSCKI